MSKPMNGPGRRGPMGPRPKVKKETLPRVLKLLYSFYPRLIPVVVFCIIFAAVINAIPSVFTKNILDVIEQSLKNHATWEQALPQIMPLIGMLIGLYLVSILLTVLQSQLMAYITQGFLNKMRRKMFDGMQNLPIKYFDTHPHGDIMSRMTNDLQNVSELAHHGPENFFICGVMVIGSFIYLFTVNWILSLIILGCVPILVTISLIMRKKMRDAFTENRKNVATINASLESSISIFRIIRIK